MILISTFQKVNIWIGLCVFTYFSMIHTFFAFLLKKSQISIVIAIADEFVSLNLVSF